MWVFGREDLRFIAVNDAAISLYGYSREQFLAMTALDIRPPEERDRFRRVVGTGLRASRETLYRGRFWRHVKADGTLIDVAIFAQNLTYEGRSAVLAAAVDITERNLAEAKLRETQEFLDTIIENVPTPIFVKNADVLRYVMINRSGEQFLGLPRNKVIGKTTHELHPRATADLITSYDKAALVLRADCRGGSCIRYAWARQTVSDQPESGCAHRWQAQARRCGHRRRDGTQGGGSAHSLFGRA